MSDFTIERLEAMREKITPGERYLHEDDWDGLMVVNDDGRDMTFGDQLRVKVEAGHPEHDGESIVAIPKLIAGLIAEKQAHAELRAEVEAMREDWGRKAERSASARDNSEHPAKAAHARHLKAHQHVIRRITSILEGDNE